MMERRFMDKRKVLGIAMICVAILIAGYYFIHPMLKGKDTNKETITTSENEEYTTQYILPETTFIEETTIEETTVENITVNEYQEEHLDLQGIEIRLPNDEVMTLVDGDSENLKKAVQAFVNGYGYGNAKYADYAGDVQINTNDGIVEMTYYLKFEKSRALYFYVTYDKNTKQWTTRLA